MKRGREGRSSGARCAGCAVLRRVNGLGACQSSQPCEGFRPSHLRLKTPASPPRNARTTPRSVQRGDITLPTRAGHVARRSAHSRHPYPTYPLDVYRSTIHVRAVISQKQRCARQLHENSSFFHPRLHIELLARPSVPRVNTGRPSPRPEQGYSAPSTTVVHKVLSLVTYQYGDRTLSMSSPGNTRTVIVLVSVMKKPSAARQAF